MNGLIKSTFLLLAVTLLLAALPTDAEAEIYEDTIRLHILANSDSPEDQALKLKIRDCVLDEYGSYLSNFATKDEAEEKIMEIIPKIERSVRQWIKDLGYEYDACAVIGTEWYETRDYGDFSLPCGYYTSLRILIGDGEGKNWWCVMYPPLCTEIATENAPSDDGVIDYTKAEMKLITNGKYNIKFKILEEVSRSFAKNG